MPYESVLNVPESAIKATMASILSKKQKKRETYNLSDLKTLGHQLLSSKAHINNLPILLTFVSRTSSPQYALEALLSLQAFFTPVLPELPPSSSSATRPSANTADQDDPEFIYRTWLRLKFDDFVSSLIDICIYPQSEEALRELGLDALMEFVKLGNGGRFNSVLYHRFIQSIVHSPVGIDVLLGFLSSKYFKFIDIRYFTYISVEKLTQSLETKEISDDKIVSLHGGNTSHSRERLELSIQKIYYILSHIPPLKGTDEKTDYEMWNGLGIFFKGCDNKKHYECQNGEYEQHRRDKSSNNIAKKMKVKFTKAWLSFLRLPLPIDVYKEVLVALHQTVIPYLSNPILLCDFLTRSYDIGGVISIMALSSLYILMTQHGLEYPNFYEKLYALLIPSIFMAKHRAKFFELLDSCLKSPLLPAYLAAAFAKKLSRLSLVVPPSGALIIIALIHNLLRRHPSIDCLVHWDDGEGTARDDSRARNDGEDKDSCKSAKMHREQAVIDHFNSKENNPVKTNAMRSSLWEIDTLRHHYCASVSRFVSSLENDLTVRSKTTEVAVKDFSSGSYGTIFRDEIGRRVKQVPLAFYKATPTSLFSESEFVSWTFTCKQNGLFTSCDNNSDIGLSEVQNLGFAKRQRIDCL